MPGFTTVTEVPVPPAAVFASITDLALWPGFTRYGPMPGFARAEVEGDGAVVLGASVRVTNTDGSVHHEIVDVFVPDVAYGCRMDLTPVTDDPAARPSAAGRVFAEIRERVDLAATPSGTRITRTFTTVPRAWTTAPAAWIVTHFLLQPAVKRHDAWGKARAEAVAAPAPVSGEADRDTTTVQ